MSSKYARHATLHEPGNEVASPVLSSLVGSLTNLKRWVKAQAKQNRPLEGFLSAFNCHLQDYEGRLKVACDAGTWEASTTWGPISARRQGPSGLHLTVDGPTTDDCFCVLAGDEGEALDIEHYVLEYHRLSGALARSETLVTTAFQTRGVGVNRESPQNIVQAHIQLLTQYNDLKDLAQQLIGLVADNRGLSLASVYNQREFGVGPLD